MLVMIRLRIDRRTPHVIAGCLVQFLELELELERRISCVGRIFRDNTGVKTWFPLRRTPKFTLIRYIQDVHKTSESVKLGLIDVVHNSRKSFEGTFACGVQSNVVVPINDGLYGVRPESRTNCF